MYSTEYASASFMTATGTEMRLPKKEAHPITNTIKNIRVMKI